MPRITHLAETYREEIFIELERLVNTNSFTANVEGVKKNAAIIIEIAQRHGLQFDVLQVPETEIETPHLLFHRPNQVDYYTLVGHFDTVHPPDSDFNRLRAEGEHLIGPGVSDMKSGLLVALYALIILKQLFPDGELPLKVLFNSDEEIGSPASRFLIDRHLAQARGGFVFEAGRANGNLVVTSRKGKANLDVEVFGTPSHAGEAPQNGANAIAEASRLIAALQGLNRPERGISVECTLISGGVARNVIPDYCRIAADIRLPDRAAVEWMSAQVAQLLDTPPKFGLRIAYQFEVKRPPLEKSPASAIFLEEYISSCAKYGMTVGEATSGSVSDANLLAGHGIPTIDGLGAMGQFPHTKNEYIIKESLMLRLIAFCDFFYNHVRSSKEK